jgi:hypothetical protein
LVFLSELLDLRFQKMGRQTETDKPGCVLSQGGRAGLGLLAEISGGIACFF